ncbi:hypothetical protein EDD41_2656 [Luteococcus japonicus]|uniref:Uncharacterized protein n=1 Tax=Luteococcus japonicus TaxID=33984 RepID=A0A3N1ZX14_9ACTN|nr:hypothetical protein EDD41_2656 [Luteococcus japonicus]
MFSTLPKRVQTANAEPRRRQDGRASVGGRADEESHSWQWTLCAGLPFLPLYAACAAWSAVRHGNPASANFFECQADLADGGYHPERQPRNAPGPAPQ